MLLVHLLISFEYSIRYHKTLLNCAISMLTMYELKLYMQTTQIIHKFNSLLFVIVIVLVYINCM